MENGASQVRVSRLETGLTVVTETMPHLKTAALGVWVKAGGRAERDVEHGIAHLLEHMAFKGTATRSARDIAEEIEAVGGELNAATGLETTAYYARVLKDHVPLAVDMLADIIQNSRFEAEELVREKHVIVQEILAAHDTPDDLVFDLVQAAAFPDQAIGRSILGTIPSVRSFEAGHLNAFLDRNYAAEQMIVAAAGAVDHDRLVELVAEKFVVARPNGADPLDAARYRGGSDLVERDLEQVHLVMGFPGVEISNGEVYAAQLLSTILGGGMSSRLFQEVRENRGLCYGIYSYHWAASDSGLFGIYAGTGPEEVGELSAVVLHELETVGKSVTVKELDRARAQLKAGLMMSLESPSARIEQMARHITAFDRIISPDELMQRVDRVTVDEIQALAARVFRPDHMALAAIGPARGLETFHTFGSNSG
ncbi:MAG: insulinase family protein [Rhodobiaceae bacterium]|nr:insulinase family protein [Rhodobiaceae bacterium]